MAKAAGLGYVVGVHRECRPAGNNGTGRGLPATPDPYHCCPQAGTPCAHPQHSQAPPLSPNYLAPGAKRKTCKDFAAGDNRCTFWLAKLSVSFVFVLLVAALLGATLWWLQRQQKRGRAENIERSRELPPLSKEQLPDFTPIAKPATAPPPVISAGNRQ